MASHRSLSQEDIQLREQAICTVAGAFQSHPVWVWEVLLLNVPMEVWDTLLPHVQWATWKATGDGRGLVGEPSQVFGPMSLHPTASER